MALATRIHSRYCRILADLPWAPVPVHLHLGFPVVMEKFWALRGERRAVSPHPPSRLSLPASYAL
jgi:hypothetical protein